MQEDEIMEGNETVKDVSKKYRLVREDGFCTPWRLVPKGGIIQDFHKQLKALGGAGRVDLEVFAIEDK